MLKPIMIVGEAWGEKEEQARAPFVGPSGTQLNQFLAIAGLSRDECYLTNVFNLRPRPTNDVLNLCGPKATAIPDLPALAPGKYIRTEFAHEIQRLYHEINAVQPNIIIALGGTALAVLVQAKLSIEDNRGGLLLTKFLRGDGTPIKLITTYHPAAVLREWKLRPIVIADFKKAARHARSPDFNRPARRIRIYPSIPDLADFEMEFFADQWDRPTAVDIETKSGTITEIGFAPACGDAIVIPFYSRLQPSGNYWATAQEEIEAWHYVKSWLTRLRRPIFQNGLYDINYLWRTMGIKTLGADEDTMLLAHAIQPEMKKKLGFLGSIYTDEPPWKLMRRSDTLKKEDE